jgi:DNA-binding GntR family transcriptional regulator
LIPELKRQPPLAQQVQQILTERIRAGVYPAGSQLPPETELADSFNVSRATIRGALSTLAATGMVVRRQGAGTFVTSVPHISNPIQRAIDFQDLIAGFEYSPSVRHIHTAEAIADTDMADRLGIEPGAPTLVSQKIFLADDRPVIYCVNTLPGELLSPDLIRELLAKPAQIEPIYDFMETRCQRRVEYHVSRVRAAAAGSCTFHGGLPLDPCEPVLVIDGVAYTAEMVPLFHTYEYHHHPDDLMTLDLVRRRPAGQ